MTCLCRCPLGDHWIDSDGVPGACLACGCPEFRRATPRAGDQAHEALCAEHRMRAALDRGWFTISIGES